MLEKFWEKKKKKKKQSNMINTKKEKKKKKRKKKKKKKKQSKDWVCSKYQRLPFFTNLDLKLKKLTWSCCVC